MPLAYGLRCAQVPSFRLCSVGPPPRAIHGPSRLSRHPCRSTHSTEPPLGLPMGRVDQDQKLARRPTGRPVGVSVCCAIFVAAEERSEAAIGCEAVAKSDTRFFQIAPGLRFYGRFAASLRSSAATGKQLSRVHIRHLHLTAILVSPLRRVTTEPPLGLSGGGSCDRHISSVGAGLARDAGTSFCLDDRRAAIAGKPGSHKGLVVLM